MQGDVAVAVRDEGVPGGRIEVLLEQHDVRPRGGADPQPFCVGDPLVRVDRLDHQHRALTGPERALERVHEADGVLPLCGGQVVEREQEDRTVRQTQLRPRECGTGAPLRQGRRQGSHRDGGVRFDGAPHEVRGDPHLVDGGEASVLRRREVLDLPVPHADAVAAAHEIGDGGGDRRREVGVDADEGGVEAFACGRLPWGPTPAREVKIDSASRVRYTGSRESVDHPAGGLADAELTCQVSNNRDPRLGMSWPWWLA